MIKLKRILKELKGNGNEKIYFNENYIFNGSSIFSKTLMEAIDEKTLSKLEESFCKTDKLLEFYKNEFRTFDYEREVKPEDFIYIASEENLNGKVRYKEKDKFKKDFFIGDKFFKSYDSHNDNIDRLESCFGINERFLSILQYLIKEFSDLKVFFKVKEKFYSDFSTHMACFQLFLNSTLVGIVMPMELKVNVEEKDSWITLKRINSDEEIFIGNHFKKEDYKY